MQKLIYFLSILLFINCYKKENLTYKEMKADKLLSESFTDYELNNLAKIVDFFEDQIYKETKESDIEKRYNEFLKNDSIRLLDKHLLFIFDYKKQEKLYLNLDSIFFKSFLDVGFGYGANINEKEYEFYNLKSYDKYGKFLEKLSQKNSYFKDYYFSTVIVNDFLSTNASYNLITNYKNYNFKDIKIRLLYSLHYIIQNEFLYKKSTKNHEKIR
tara:strand:+ start:203 stop:844 length:642 start_codon:yes stop_codon:yes gene_type:complete